MGRGNTEKQLHTVPPPGSALRKGCIQRGSSSSYGTENLFPPSPPAGDLLLQYPSLHTCTYVCASHDLKYRGIWI